MSTNTPAITANVSFTLSSAMQTRLTAIFKHVLSAVSLLTAAGVIDAYNTIKAGGKLASVSVTLPATVVPAFCQALGSIASTDALASEVATILAAVPVGMRKPVRFVPRPASRPVKRPPSQPVKRPQPKKK